MSAVANRRILLGITGSIAAYKACELIRLLKKAHAEVKVVLTEGGGKFITPMTLQALSGERVWTDLLDVEAEAAMGHIELARWADMVVVAPASANFIARCATGMADDLLSTLVLATKSQVFIAPAMNQQMWQNSVTQENIQKLQKEGVVIWEPAEGDQACGETGPGRFLEPEELFIRCEQQFQTNTLTDKVVLITAGPTQEPIDPVRYLSNRSSGKMGYALAEAARDAGATVILITGPTALAIPDRVQCIEVVTAHQMYEAVMKNIHRADIFISAAAVADYHVAQPATEKIKKEAKSLTMELLKTPDILSAVTALPNKPFVVGFAAETEQVIERAKEKLRKKTLDMVIANQVGENLVFGQDENEVTVITLQWQQSFPKQSKRALADQLVKLFFKE